ncbi:MAG TPA: PilZ domain-containing protein [Pseudobdellovibrionaceae bacterium]|nr:PilZ domain-containing protein [Pseudobdellovibrionaceae bacterium]
MVFRHFVEQAKLEDSRSGTRRAPRRTYRRPMGLLFDGEYQVIEGRQLSEGGAMIVVPASLARRWTAGRSGTLALILPEQLGADTEGKANSDEGAMVLRAVAIYQNAVPEGVAIGLKFTELPFQHRRRIRNYVAAKSADEVAFETQGGRDAQRAASESEPLGDGASASSGGPSPASPIGPSDHFTRAKPPQAGS